MALCNFIRFYLFARTTLATVKIPFEIIIANLKILKGVKITFDDLTKEFLIAYGL